MLIHGDLIPIIHKYDPRYKKQYNKVLRELIYVSLIRDMERNPALIEIESDIISGWYTVQPSRLLETLELWTIERYYNYNFGCLFLTKDEFVNGSFTIKLFYDYMYNANNVLLDVSEMIEDQDLEIMDLYRMNHLYDS